MKRITAVFAAVAMLALGVAGPAGAAGKAVGKNTTKPPVTCTTQHNADGTTTSTCINQQTGDVEVQTEAEAD